MSRRDFERIQPSVSNEIMQSSAVSNVADMPSLKIRPCLQGNLESMKKLVVINSQRLLNDAK